MEQLTNGVLKADIKAIAKLMRYIEEEDARAIDELKLLYVNTGHSHVIGITGLPGSGKSTLIIHNGSDPYTAAEKTLNQFLNFKK